MKIITHAEWIKLITKSIEDYIERKINAKVFQAIFFKWWAYKEEAKNEKEMAEYYIMHDLFYDLEEFCIYPHLRKKGEINEKGLHKVACSILKRLREFEKTQDIEKVHRESETYSNWQKGCL